MKNTQTATEVHRVVTRLSWHIHIANAAWAACAVAFIVAGAIALSDNFPPRVLADPAGTASVQ